MMNKNNLQRGIIVTVIMILGIIFSNI